MKKSVLGIRIRNRIRMFFGPTGTGSGSGSAFLINVLSGLKQCLQNKILRQEVIVRTYIICKLTTLMYR